jgi:hypothetical protein
MNWFSRERPVLNAAVFNAANNGFGELSLTWSVPGPKASRRRSDSRPGRMTATVWPRISGSHTAAPVYVCVVT